MKLEELLVHTDRLKELIEQMVTTQEPEDVRIEMRLREQISMDPDTVILGTLKKFPDRDRLRKLYALRKASQALTAYMDWKQNS